MFLSEFHGLLKVLLVPRALLLEGSLRELADTHLLSATIEKHAVKTRFKNRECYIGGVNIW